MPRSFSQAHPTQHKHNSSHSKRKSELDSSNKARVRTIPHAQTLNNSHDCQRRCSRLVAAFVVRSSSASEQSDQHTGDGLVVDVIDASLSPLVVQYALR